MARKGRQDDDRRPRLDFPGYAQEFLRRSPDYRRDYESVMTDPDAGPALQEVMARRWALCFPGRPAPAGARGTGLLGGGRLSLCRHRRCRAFRPPRCAGLRLRTGFVHRRAACRSPGRGGRAPLHSRA
ncbi:MULTISPECIES: transcriptional regulator domain-containing protein [Sphingopyxis]|uniref:transcriptional regulator domain-containing protein n=1 Tax=Sphingopyxis TaxID=165697 RepID=UPI003AFAE14E